jgi:hypothetical protein
MQNLEERESRRVEKLQLADTRENSTLEEKLDRSIF